MIINRRRLLNRDNKYNFDHILFDPLYMAFGTDISGVTTFQSNDPSQVTNYTNFLAMGNTLKNECDTNKKAIIAYTVKAVLKNSKNKEKKLDLRDYCVQNGVSCKLVGKTNKYKPTYTTPSSSNRNIIFNVNRAASWSNSPRSVEVYCNSSTSNTYTWEWKNSGASQKVTGTGFSCDVETENAATGNSTIIDSITIDGQEVHYVWGNWNGISNPVPLYAAGVENTEWSSLGTPGNVTKNFYNIYLKTQNPYGYSSLSSNTDAIVTSNKVDLNGYSKLNVDFRISDNIGGAPFLGVCVFLTSTLDNWWNNIEYQQSITNIRGEHSISVDTGSYQDEYYIIIVSINDYGGTAWTYLTVNNVWLQ